MTESPGSRPKLRRIKAAASFDLEACEFSVRDAVMALGG